MVFRKEKDGQQKTNVYLQCSVCMYFFAKRKKTCFALKYQIWNCFSCFCVADHHVDSLKTKTNRGTKNKGVDNDNYVECFTFFATGCEHCSEKSD
jgi:hypothetical protein